MGAWGVSSSGFEASAPGATGDGALDREWVGTAGERSVSGERRAGTRAWRRWG
jgi:hypothetical protein